MVQLRSIMLLLFVATAPMAWVAKPAFAAPQVGENASQLPTWQSNWFIALRSGSCSEAERYLIEGRRSNEAVADTMEAVMVRDGICRPADPGKAVTLFQRAIGQRYIPAMWGLASGFLGHGLPADEAKARWWFQAALLRWFTHPKWLNAKDEIVEALLYLPPDEELPDWWGDDEFLRIMKIAILSEDAKADNADRIEAGDGFLPDPQAACLWRIDAVKSGSSKAAVALGDQLLQGRGVPARPDRAAYWWNMYASPAARARLGELLIDGAAGVPADPRTAAIFLASAKRGGEAVDDKLRLTESRAGLSPGAALHLPLKMAFPTNPPWNHPNEMDCW
ncbi:tetratricopeptide repeat protein [Magnetospirillum sulfuroxidans]|uniref:Sel1 repeat family protein n=1 Tax=Magnetospirillum sulfuroxidans TaxID=611300 RepID=A0ABS5IJ90_9PROT|nr:SEL1-like repeat protein [Magnetospirillum sulfuroxidans]MBR9973853.1 sel1 repeat family protein [Magnetospirillum sulfuroxidans]